VTESRTGAVTFLFTDVEGSTRWWEDYPDEMALALRIHDGVLRGAIEANRGEVFATGGDGFAVAFNDPVDAVAAALDAQEGLARAAWGEAVRLQARMGMHTGAAEARGGDYFGPTLNRAARLMGAGHGGQVLVSESTRALLEPGAFELLDLGRHRLKDVTHPQQVFQVGSARFEPLRSIQGAVGNLPRERTSFIGRKGLVDEVAAAVDDHVSSPSLGLAASARHVWRSRSHAALR
jgi:class 3 adenylate cyclase